ncbi:MAG TPA: hypothetical protein VGP92_05195 [Acidimicrobiia bacterium]|nr:hypothetical protein [Acidimicrobiia bacterium]
MITQEASEPTTDESTADVSRDSTGFFAECEPPSWLLWLALSAAAGVLCFGAVGLLLAMNGWYRPALAFPIGAVVWIALLLLARPVCGPNLRGSRIAHVFAVIGVAAVVAITVWNASHASQHVLVNRDGGSYTNTARWIARDGSLSVKPRVGPFAHASSVQFDSLAVYSMPDGTLQFQFAHLLPVVLAEAYAIKGDAGLFHAPELLAGIALLAFFVLAWRLFRRPLFALSAMLALAFLIPQISFSRDSYSEIPSQIIIFTALWVLVSPRLLPTWRVALTSGLFLGALEAVRIDAVVFLIGVPVLVALAWMHADRHESRRPLLMSMGAFTAGLVPGMVLGFTDLTRHSGHYWRDLSHNVNLLGLVVVASALASALVAVAWPAVFPLVRGWPWPRFATAAGVLAALTGFFVWIERPHLQILHGKKPTGLVGGLQAAEHVAIDPSRNYFERSLTWMGWYLGPVTLAVAIIAAGFLVHALLLGRMRRVTAVLVVLAPGSLLYLYKADAVPDHVWVTRRFLVSAFPLLLLLALGLAAAVAGRSSSRYRVPLRVGAVAFAIVAVVYPLHEMWKLRSITEQRGFLAIVHDACDDIGPHAAVLVLEEDQGDLFDDWIPQGLRGWCGAEVGATRGGADAGTIQSLARAWRSEGRKLFVVAKSADIITKVFPTIAVTTTPQATNTKFLRLTLTHRPNEYMTQALEISVAQVPSD